jgi:hypothetical protein
MLTNSFMGKKEYITLRNGHCIIDRKAKYNLNYIKHNSLNVFCNGIFNSFNITDDYSGTKSIMLHQVCRW